MSDSPYTYLRPSYTYTGFDPALNLDYSALVAHDMAQTAPNPDPLDLPLSERPLIYVAGYFSANPMHGTANAVKAFDALLEVGWLPYVPHASIVVDMLSPHTPEFWYSYDIGIFKRCDAMYVCQDPLTAKSTGVGAEMAYAWDHDIPIIDSIVSPTEVLG